MSPGRDLARSFIQSRYVTHSNKLAKPAKSSKRYTNAPCIMSVQCTGGYHEYTGGCSVHWGFHTNSIVFPMTSPHIMISPSVLMISPRCTEHPPLCCTPPVYCADIMQGEMFHRAGHHIMCSYYTLIT